MTATHDSWPEIKTTAPIPAARPQLRPLDANGNSAGGLVISRTRQARELALASRTPRVSKAQCLFGVTANPLRGQTANVRSWLRFLCPDPEMTSVSEPAFIGRSVPVDIRNAWCRSGTNSRPR
jgi:hypothetical protein